ncbi:hypothetical protein [Methylocella silvestris]|uniref:Uncharacterized protein n=1 Tax=Methylocella silvestris TaxID=199596 RepID=A0A2J7TG37_METSI|nr:hypothetical protein [Methylocella silvestris]PNG25716.1 hypothetical protein CR492_12425 [Methylocella silvestris]
MKITVELDPKDLSAITEQVLKAAGPEALSKLWMEIGQQIAEQMQAKMLSQVPEALQPFFNLYGGAKGKKS